MKPIKISGLLDKLRYKLLVLSVNKMEQHGQLADWLYLIHHVHTDDNTGEEELHHCFLVDHLGNLYTIDHIIDDDGVVYHALVGLAEDQEVFWSNEEAIDAGETIPCANRQLPSE